MDIVEYIKNNNWRVVIDAYLLVNDVKKFIDMNIACISSSNILKPFSRGTMRYILENKPYVGLYSYQRGINMFSDVEVIGGGYGIYCPATIPNVRQIIWLVNNGWKPNRLIINPDLRPDILDEIAHMLKYSVSISFVRISMPEIMATNIMLCNQTIGEIYHIPGMIDSEVPDHLAIEGRANRRIWTADKHFGKRDEYVSILTLKSNPRYIIMLSIMCMHASDDTWLPKDVMEQDLIPYVYAAVYTDDIYRWLI